MNNQQKGSSNVPFILKRSFLGSSIGVIIFAPLFAIYIIVKFFPNTGSNLFSMDINSAGGGPVVPPILWIIFLYMLIAAVYFFIVNHLQFIERIIRLYLNTAFQDSQTLQIAKKIFKNSLRFELSLFFRYYCVPFVLALVALGFGLSAILSFAFNESQDVATAFYKLAVVPVAIMIIYLYMHYYLSTRLRYIWFAYLNNYGDSNFIAKAFTEMKSLNSISGGKAFRKILGTEIKNDMLADAVGFGTGTAISKLPVGGNLGNLGKEVLGGYVGGVVRDTASYSTLETKFNLYRESYSKFFNKDFTPNQKLSV